MYTVKISRAIISSAEPPETPSRRFTATGTAGGPQCKCCRGRAIGAHGLCLGCWGLAGQPAAVPSEPVLRGIQEARAFGWASPVCKRCGNGMGRILSAECDLCTENLSPRESGGLMGDPA